MLCIITPSLVAPILSISCYAAEHTCVSKDFADPFLVHTAEMLSKITSIERRGTSVDTFLLQLTDGSLREISRHKEARDGTVQDNFVCYRSSGQKNSDGNPDLDQEGFTKAQFMITESVYWAYIEEQVRKNLLIQETKREQIKELIKTEAAKKETGTGKRSWWFSKKKDE